jgi:hypothetical protein
MMFKVLRVKKETVSNYIVSARKRRTEQYFWWGQSIFLRFLLFTGCLEPNPCRRLLKISGIVVFLCRILDGSICCFNTAGMDEVKGRTTNLKLAESLNTV